MSRRQSALVVLSATTLIAALSSCAHRRANIQRSAELRGIYRTGLETNHFMPCADTVRLGYFVRWDSARNPERSWPRSMVHEANASVYYVRWIAEIIPDTSAPPPPGTIRLGGGPRVLVHEVLEARTPQYGECGWRPRTNVQ
jgi:hypothetical protein